MPYFEWDDSFTTHVTRIDEQHRRLIGLINRLHDAIERSNELATMSAVMNELVTATSVVNELVNYALYHFSTEEEYMSDYAFPAYAAHKQEHEQFIRRVDAFRRELEAHKGRLSIDIVEFLVEWWRSHILSSDKKCGAFLNEQGVH